MRFNKITILVLFASLLLSEIHTTFHKGIKQISPAAITNR